MAGVIDLAKVDLGDIRLGLDLGGGQDSAVKGPDYNVDFNQDFRAATE